MFNALTFDAEERAQGHRLPTGPGTNPASRKSPRRPPSATLPTDADGALPSGFLREFGLCRYIRPHVPRGAHPCASTVGEVKAMIATSTLEIELDIEKARRS